MRLLILSLILFIGLHLMRVVAPGFRQQMIDKVGKPVWGAVHGILSVVTLLFLAYAFNERAACTVPSTSRLSGPRIWR
jgi:uncharacterized membrane protein